MEVGFSELREMQYFFPLLSDIGLFTRSLQN